MILGLFRTTLVYEFILFCVVVILLRLIEQKVPKNFVFLPFNLNKKTTKKNRINSYTRVVLNNPRIIHANFGLPTSYIKKALGFLRLKMLLLGNGNLPHLTSNKWQIVTKCKLNRHKFFLFDLTDDIKITS